ncbi:MAG: SMI1/KNR4 family protein [Chlorobi bacterium]|nr:SMI1/KNR4 family protein [Chlorobiota bacterium]
MNKFEQFKDQLNQLAEYIDSLENAFLEEYNLNPGADDLTIQEAIRQAKERGIIIPDDFINFYKEINGATLIWQLDCIEETETNAPGRINIVPIEEFVEDGEDHLYFPDFGETEEDKFFFEGYDMRRMNIFDAFIAEAGTLVYFPQANEPEYQFFYHYYGEELKPKDGLTLEQYLNWAIMTKGFWYWIESLNEEFNSWDEFIDWAKTTNYVMDLPENCQKILIDLLAKRTKEI